jgi:hypothetical protein
MAAAHLITGPEGVPVASYCTIALAAGAANTMTATIQVKDAKGANVLAPTVLEAFISTSATGQGLTATAASGSLTATTGAILTALTAKKHVKAITDANGALVLSLVDSAKTAGEYVVVRNPSGGGIKVSSASVTGSYGA